MSFTKCNIILIKPTKRKSDVEGFSMFEIIPCDKEQQPVAKPLLLDATKLDFGIKAQPISGGIKIDCQNGYIRLFSSDMDFIFSSFDEEFEIKMAEKS